MQRSELNSSVLTRACGLLVAGVGLVVLAGWFFKIPALTQFDEGSLPMAPSSALASVVFVVLLALSANRNSRSLRWIFLAFGVLVVLLAALNCFGVHLQVEHLGFDIPHLFWGRIQRVGHQAPLPATSFFCLSVAYFISNGRSRSGNWRSLFVGAVCSLNALVGLFVGLTYLVKLSVFFEGTVYPFPFPTSLVVVGLTVGVLAREWPQWMGRKQAENYPIAAGQMLIFLVFSALVGSFFLFKSYSDYYRSWAEKELVTIGQLKVAEVTHWRDECLADGEIIRNNPTFVGLVRDYFFGRSSVAKKRAERDLGRWLERYPLDYEYNQVRLLDVRGDTRMLFLRPGAGSGYGHSGVLSSDLLAQAREAIRSKKITLVDVYPESPGQPIELLVLTPIHDSTVGSTVIGLVALWIDPERYLAPLVLLRNPTHSEQSSLIQYDSVSDPFFLSSIELAQGSVVRTRVSLDQRDSVKVKSIRGKTGIVEGLHESTSEPQIAYIGKVPGSSWSFVTQMSLAAVYAPIKDYLWVMAGLLVAVTFSMGMVLVVLVSRWRERALKKSQTFLEETQAVGRIGTYDLSLSDFSNRSKSMQGLVGSKVWFEIMGLPEGTLVTHSSWSRLVHPEDWPRVEAYSCEIIGKRGEQFDQTYRIVKPQAGAVRWVHVLGKLQYNEKREPLRMFGTTQDVTDSKELEQALIQAKEFAEKAAKSKARFLDIAAHELRNPVTALSLLFELAERRFKKGESVGSSFLSRFREPLERLTYLVVDLLDASKLERGILTLNLKRGDLVSLASTCMDEFQLQAPQRHFVMNTSDPIMDDEFDEIRINQVLSNLLDNAVKYTPPQSSIEVKLERLPEFVRVSVVDEGTGVDSSKLEQLFNPFSRGDTQMAIRAGGLGLGLSICKGIIGLHGGTIHARSEKGRGSVFYFELPRKELIA